MKLLSETDLNYQEIMEQASGAELDEWMYRMEVSCIQIFCNGERFEGDVIVSAAHRYIAFTREAFGDEYEVVSFEDKLFDPYVLDERLTLNFNYTFGFVFDSEEDFAHLLYVLYLADYNYKNGIHFQKPALPTTPFEPKPGHLSENATENAGENAAFVPLHFFHVSITYMDYFYDAAYVGIADVLDLTAENEFGFFAVKCDAKGSFQFQHGEVPIEQIALNFFKVQAVYCDKASLKIYVSLAPMNGTLADYVLSAKGAVFRVNNEFDYERLGAYFHSAIGR